MIFTGDNLLTEDEQLYVNTLIDDFAADEVPGFKKYEYRRDYFRQSVELPNEINEKIKNIILKHTNREVTIAGTWINRIDNMSNKSDDYHKDDTDISFIFYPDDNFNGGEVECIMNGEVNVNNIKSNAYIILTNKILHRVKPVTDGIRWSIALFCVYHSKTINLI